jgi:Zn-dependent protease with chaperone function
MALMPVDALRGQAGEPLAVAGGSVFIPLSLLATAPDEAVFAFQLAHAMAHIALRHPTRLATKTELMQISMQVAPNGRGAQNIPMMSALAFSRANEREADYVAVRMVSQAGYSPEAMAAYVGGQPDPRESQALAARAVSSERAKAIRAEIEKLPSASYAASTGGCHCRWDIRDHATPRTLACGGSFSRAGGFSTIRPRVSIG